MKAFRPRKDQVAKEKKFRMGEFDATMRGKPHK